MTRDILITATQTDLAQLAGSSRESASRFLAVLERAGIITQGRGKLTVHDPAALERYVYLSEPSRRSSRPAVWSCDGDRGGRHRPRQARRRRAAGAGAPQGPPRRRRDPRAGRAARGRRGDRRHRRADRRAR